MSIRKTAMALPGTLLEAALIYVTLLCMMSTASHLPWRLWIDEAVWARVAPSVLVALCITGLFRLTRPRYGLTAQLSHTTRTPDILTRRFTVATLAIAPLCMGLSIDELAPSEARQLITASALGASLLHVLCIALSEEFVYRQVLLGRLLRQGIPHLPAILIQAAVFLLGHGKQALTDPQTIAWYLVGGAMLGTLYVATRSIVWPVALHMVVDLCVAQTSTSPYWLTQRVIEATRFDWTTATSWGWALVLCGYWMNILHLKRVRPHHPLPVLTP